MTLLSRVGLNGPLRSRLAGCAGQVADCHERGWVSAVGPAEKGTLRANSGEILSFFSCFWFCFCYYKQDLWKACSMVARVGSARGVLSAFLLSQQL